MVRETRSPITKNIYRWQSPVVGLDVNRFPHQTRYEEEKNNPQMEFRAKFESDSCNTSIRVSYTLWHVRSIELVLTIRNPSCRKPPPPPPSPPYGFPPGTVLSGCNRLTFVLAFCWQINGASYDINGNVIVDLTPISDDEYCAVFREIFPSPNRTNSEIFFAAGATGEELFFHPNATAFPAVNEVPLNPNNGYPTYSCKSFSIVAYNIASIGEFEEALKSLVTTRPNEINILDFDYDQSATCDIPPVSSPPPPPPMSCCPNVRENDALLKLIAKRLGVYDYPVTVPKTITDESQGSTSLENLTRFVSYTVKQLDAISGNYPIEIELADADLTQAGDQKQKIKIPNAAEGIAEALGQLLVIRSETNATLNAVVRALLDIASTKQAAIITHDYVRANSEFLGYKGKQVMRKVPFAITVGKERLDELLQESEFEIKGFENDDKDDIKDLLIPLMDMAAMFRAQNFRNLGKDTLGALRELLNRNTQTGDLLNNEGIKKPDIDPEKQENRFDSFIENAETGFINKAGITDNTNPYGRPYEERPKIREIGDTTGAN